ncbi:YbaK/prolyl-tRNA synthetase-like protein [Giardia lamblia P15]|uniref:YbaK/prolyl-tRNA synthetase-like protein n=1 Tax=Giardia intestinalis (strain P15) TaxID=658858 RepID=E1EVW1_GIAIA|nr:YbaK/prolyl-tRNA synthetase-like protein [Giardia lamblia P15]
MERRLEVLETKISTLAQLANVPDDADVLHILAIAHKCGFTRPLAVRTPEDYYDQELSARPIMLGYCQSTANLCKTIVLENTKAPRTAADPLFSRYYLIVIQYIRKFSSSKFHSAMRRLAKESTDMYLKSLTKNDYAWRFCEESEAVALTGAPHNGMGPIGTSVNIPLVLDANIPQTVNNMWVGGMHPLVKLRVCCTEFKNLLMPLVLDCTDNL